MQSVWKVLIAGSLALLAAACGKSGSSSASSPTGTVSAPATVSSSASGYHPVIDAANFQAVVDNPWFPLKPGSTWTYTGTKDGEPSRDVYVVTRDTKIIGGVPCVIISDRLYLSGVLEERTSDYYTQDRQGNVWYFGEDTAELDKNGNVKSTEGSWLTGQDGAQPGIFMQANPTVSQTFRQEYYAGHAEDQFKVVSLASPVTVPYGAFSDALLTQEWTALEPDVLDHKYYAKGVGEVAELSVKGPVERARLVSYTTG
jgi:hypothetical protein